MMQAKDLSLFESGELQRVLERFDWLIEEVRDQVHRSDVFELRQTLCDPKARTSAKERALVILGLMGTAQAWAVLRWFDSRGAHRRVRLLHRLARRECARRRDDAGRRDSSGSAEPAERAA